MTISQTFADRRRYRIEALEGRRTGSASPGQAVYVKRMLYTEIYERMAECGQLSADQFAAAAWLHALWMAAGLNPRVVAKIDTLRECVGTADIYHGADEDEGEPIDRWRAIMMRIGAQKAATVESLMCGRHPGCKWLATLQAALDDIALSQGLNQRRIPLAGPKQPESR